MATYTYPTSPSFRDITLKLDDPSISFRSQNGRRIIRKVSGHLWSGTLTYPPMKAATFAPIRGFIAKLRGEFNTFTVIPPNMATPQGTQLTDTTVSVNAAAGAISISISGAGASKTFKAGDVVKFSNHAKVYMLTDDSTASGGGAATLNIAPPLVSAITTAHTAKHSNVPFTMALTNKVQEFKTGVDGFSSFELDMIEVFE